MLSTQGNSPLLTERSALVREALPVPEADPEAFLRSMTGGPRGYWSHGGAWTAYGGILAGTGGGPVQAGDRYAHVEDARHRLLETVVPDETGEAPPPRLYGGFAFHVDHRPVVEWRGFPTLRFILPSLELHGGGAGGPVLVGQVLADDAPSERRRAAGALRDRLARIRDGAHRNGRSTVTRDGAGAGRLQVREGVDRAVWEAAVARILEAIRAGELSKAVLARYLDVVSSGPGRGGPDPVSVLSRLRDQNDDAHVFLYEPEPGAVFLGAAPETVAALRGGRFHATAVAGSVAVGAGPEERSRLARRLLQSAKDRAEHACTLEDMLGRVEGLAGPLRHDREPRVLSLARIQHLQTRIHGPARPGETVLSLLAALHPTPAVCGFPRDPARELLAAEEPFRRGWYAGPVGWVDGEGEGVFVPALRSAVGGNGRWRLFAGAGVVEGSEPTDEWEETGIKFEPMLQALGLGRP